MHPSFEQFVSALRDPSQRASIGLTISDADAAALLTRQDWATDYYHQWLAMFPTAAAEAQSAAASATPPAGSADAFGPPPGAAPSSGAPYGAQQYGAQPYGAQPYGAQPYGAAQYGAATQLGSASRVPSGLKRLLIIGGSVIGAVLLIVVGVAVYSGIVAGSTSHPVVHTSTSAAAAPLPADLHGLSAREYPVIESVFESENRTIPEMVSQGMTDDRIRALADTVLPAADKACTQAKSTQDGFDDPKFKESFIDGYVSTSKATRDAAGKVYDAIVAYCTAG